MTAGQVSRALRFVTSGEAHVEDAPWGTHWWLSKPDLTGTQQLTLVRVRMRPGAGHQFHYHPALEEIIYILDGVAEQWVGEERRQLKAGEIAFIPRGVVHAIHNTSRRAMSFLAILSPAIAKGPFLIDCYNEEPWRSLRAPFGAERAGDRSRAARGSRRKTPTPRSGGRTRRV